jgi:hypothetical protein
MVSHDLRSRHKLVARQPPLPLVLSRTSPPAEQLQRDIARRDRTRHIGPDPAHFGYAGRHW